MDDIERIIDEYLREQLEITEDDDDYGVELNLFDAGYLDSVGAMQLIVFIEERFAVEISQKDITLYPMNTIEEIASVVRRKKSDVVS